MRGLVSIVSSATAGSSPSSRSYARLDFSLSVRLPVFRNRGRIKLNKEIQRTLRTSANVNHGQEIEAEFELFGFYSDLWLNAAVPALPMICVQDQSQICHEN